MTETLEDSAIPKPRENPELLGHELAEKTLLDGWNSGRLPHGWLITGPRGIGKATLAFRFARFVLSQDGNSGGLFGDAPVSLHTDPESPVFRRVVSEGHGDLMTLERRMNKEGKRLRGSIVVDEVRAAGRFLSLTAGEGGWRVLIVDAADDLNSNAANALLKTLEEPPKRTLVMLVCHSPGRLPATVRSRCCRLALRPLSLELTEQLLARHAPGLADEEIKELAYLGEGSIGRSLRLVETGGLGIFSEIMSLLENLPGADISALHRLGDRLARPDAENAYRTATDLLTWWLARVIRTGARFRTQEDHRAAAQSEIIRGEADCARNLLALAGLDRWAEVWEKITRLIAQADGVNLDRKQVILNAFHAMETAARP
ncbi:MAG: DNA polymerase III subunit delta' [Rhodospirillales bacterium]|nr:DNA polymerase III subunit delta' [Rhodospirillales bacterium]